MADPVTGLTPAPAAGQQPFRFAAAPTAPGFDVIEILPEGAPQDRLRALRQRSLDLHALMPPFEDVRTASLARQEAQNALTRLVSFVTRMFAAMSLRQVIVGSVSGRKDRAREPGASRGRVHWAASFRCPHSSGTLRKYLRALGCSGVPASAQYARQAASRSARR